MTEHVLVVGGGQELPGLLRRYREGVRTSVMCQLSLLPLLREVSGHERVLSLRPDAPGEEWIAVARAVHAADPITRIATFGERDQDRAAALGAALGVTAPTPATVEAVRDKQMMRRVLAESGVEDVRSATLDSAELLAKWLDTEAGRWVVKPLDGSGSAGVSIVDSSERAAAAYDRCVGSAHTGQPGSARVLVEEYLSGPQVSVESFSENGEHCVVAVTGKFSDPVTLVELGHVVPAELSAEATSAVETHVGRVLDALGVREGACHTEVVLTDRGPRVIETHLRLAGDEIPDLVHDATGVDLVGFLIRQTLGEQVLPAIHKTLAESAGRDAQAIWFGAAPCAGTLVRVDGADESVVRDIPDGAPVTELRDSASRPLWARASGPTPAAAIESARAAVAQCTFVVAAPSPVKEYL